MREITTVKWVIEEFAVENPEQGRRYLLELLHKKVHIEGMSLTDRLVKTAGHILEWLTPSDAVGFVATTPGLPSFPELVPEDCDAVMEELVDVALSYNHLQRAEFVLTVLSELSDRYEGRFRPQVDRLRTGLKALGGGQPAAAGREGGGASTFTQVVTSPETAKKVISKLHELMQGREKPKDALMPLRAAMDAGAIRRPTWPEFCNEFGTDRISSKGLYSKYTGENYEYVGDDYELVKKVFLDINE